MDRHRSILMFGAPGVGKGTQGRLLGCVPGFHHCATGDIFRSLDKTSPLGRQFMEFSSRGELVPDDLTVELWKQSVAERIEAGQFRPRRDLLVLDGIPRSCSQAEALNGSIDVLRVIHLAAPDIDEMVSRMKLRAQREGRHDDADEAVIRRRFEVYERETAPVIDHYGGELVAEVNAVGTPVTVLKRVLDVVAPIFDRAYGNPLG